MIKQLSENLASRIRAEKEDENIILNELRDAGVVKVKGRTCCCPFCKENNPSSGIYKRNGTWSFKCHSGKECQFIGDYLDIRARNMNTTPEKLIKEMANMEVTKEPPKKLMMLADIEDSLSQYGQVKENYVYKDPIKNKIDGVVFKIIEFNGKKTFRPARNMGGDYYTMEGMPKPWPLYNRESLIEDAESPVIVVEGERDVKTLQKLGFLATSSLAGAGKAKHADWSWLKDREVYLWPDNDVPGVKHMKQVEEILSSPDIDSQISWVDGYKDMPEKGDVTDLSILAYREYSVNHHKGSKMPPEMAAKALAYCKECISALIESTLRSIPRGNTGQLQEYMNNIADGKIEQHDMSHTFTSEATNAYRSGMGTILVGPPESGKSWFVVQEVYDLNHRGIKTACLMLEQDKQFFHQRLLAQLSGNSSVLDFSYVKSHRGEMMEMIKKYKNDLDLANLYTQKDVDISCRIGEYSHKSEKELCVRWVQQQFESDVKIVFIDPITALEGEGNIWEDDLRMVKGIKSLCEEHNKTCVLVTHPSESTIAVKARPSPEQIQQSVAGGKAMTRFFQTVLWLQKKPNKEEVVVKSSSFGGTELVDASHIMYIGKANNGYGGGMSVAFNFNTDNNRMKFKEIGRVMPKNS